MLTTLAAALLGIIPPLHPDAQAMLDASAFDGAALLEMDPEVLQAQMNAAAPPPCGIEIERVEDMEVRTSIGSTSCRLYHPMPDVSLPLLVWFHGGGWVLGSVNRADAMCRLMAQRGGMAMLSVEYPLAPQHPFPAAVDTCEAVTAWAIAHAEKLGADAGRIAVGGDSAGGNLAAVTAAAVSGQLAAQFLVYPATDALAETASRERFAEGYMLETRHMDWFLDAYAPDRETWGDVRISPLRGDLAGLPHTVVLAAQIDVLRDEAVQYAAKAIEAGVSVDLLVAQGLLHGFAGQWAGSTARRQAFERGIDLLAGVLHDGPLEEMAMLDLNLDGGIEPGEAADAISWSLDDEPNASLDVNALRMMAAMHHAGRREELAEAWDALNTNGDSWIDENEIQGDLQCLMGTLDRDSDNQLTMRELAGMNDLEGPLIWHVEAGGILGEYDQDGDGGVSLDEARRQGDQELVDEADANGDGRVDAQELLRAMADWSAPLWFEVDGDHAVAYGTIDGCTPGRVMELVLQHPDVSTIVLRDVPGSVDDESNMRACRLIRRHGLATHVPADGEIASGGVDMFLAGVERTVAPGGRLGVHSWGGLGEAGDSVDRTHEAHAMYLDYGREMGVPDAFYWFTLEAAGPDDIHWMTREEIERFGLVTKTATSAERVNGDAPLAFGLMATPEEDRRLRREGFTKQALVMAPSGEPIRIVAQAGVPDIAVARARNLLRFFLTDVPGSKYGADKSAVANAMARNGAMLMMPTGAHRPGHEPDIEAQPLFQDETPIDGSKWYVENNWDHRDAAFEEIFHLVHDAGIGTWMPGALPAYQEELDRAARQAIADGRWGIAVDPGVREWLDELEEEDSLAQEYIASAIDTYYGLWSAFDEGPGGMWGIYAAKTRDAMNDLDPQGLELVRAFLPPMMVGYEALIDPSFDGEFVLAFDEDLPYTSKSRYFVDATLTGARDSSLRGNDSDNVLRGNGGDNTLRGGSGLDTVLFTGTRDEYEVTADGGVFIVSDTVPGRDGCDRLESIERIRFGDGEVVHVHP